MLKHKQVQVTFSSWHRYIPFSKSFLPSASLSIVGDGRSVRIDMKCEDFHSKKWDQFANAQIVYNPSFQATYGCALQVLNEKTKTHSDLLVACA